MQSRRKTATDFRYLITETSGPTSHDPLDADSTHNLPVARMLYLTPLEVSGEDKLESKVLSHFSYDSNSHVVTWIVRDGLYFNDGTPILVEDVVLSVLRMAAERPKFPVIREILGVEKWSKSAHPLLSLPEGIRVEGKQIQILLTRDVDHPLFRFCLEIFGIIPSRCVDRKTNTLTCEKPPESGLYEVELKSQAKITFKRRMNTGVEISVPQKITFEYVSPRFVLEHEITDMETVLATNEGLFSPSEIRLLKAKYYTHYLPRSRFSSFLLRPDVPPFARSECRLLFASELRKQYGVLTNSGSQIEGSISPKIVPGYLPVSVLDSDYQLSREAKEECREIFQRHPIRWSIVANFRAPLFEDAVKSTLKALGQANPEPMVFQSFSEQQTSFVGGKIDLMRVASGLWPLDPFGDLQMLFTPNMHEILKPLHNDSVLQTLLGDLRLNLPSSEKRKKAEELNRHLYREGIFNVLEHISRFYISQTGVIPSSLPAAITSPAPWQVFQAP